jgi:hypothetical protein
MTMNGKGLGRKRSWHNLRYYAGIRLEGPRKTTKNFNQNSRSSGPRFETETSLIRIRSVNHPTTTFGNKTIITNYWCKRYPQTLTLQDMLLKLFYTYDTSSVRNKTLKQQFRLSRKIIKHVIKVQGRTT